MAIAVAVASALTVNPAMGDVLLTPGNFTGFGFDKCQTPTQAQMDTWLTTSRYWAVGVYISGNMRACSDQPNLTADWVATQTRNGWKILPITVGPQARCNQWKVSIRSDPTDNFAKARAQGRRVASNAISAAATLGIAKGSTLWYDLEAFDISKQNCRESSLAFLSAWTRELHRAHWSSGVYSSAASGITALEEARLYTPKKYSLPDYIWFAHWNDKATINTAYIAPDGWMPHGRMHQFLGGHTEWHGGVPLTIDSNFLDLGTGSVPAHTPKHCGGVNLNFADYPVIGPGSRSNLVAAAKCLLKEQGYYHHGINRHYTDATKKAVRQFRQANGFIPGSKLRPQHWSVLLSAGRTDLAKYGSYGEMVRRLQRALNAVLPNELPITGSFAGLTRAAVRQYQEGIGETSNGIVTQSVWDALAAGALPTATPSPTASPSPSPTSSTTTSSPTATPTS